jgi:hypothetical protein
LDCSISAIEAENQERVVEHNDVTEDGDENETEPEPVPELENVDGDNVEEDSFNNEEVSALLANITKAQHPACTVCDVMQ